MDKSWEIMNMEMYEVQLTEHVCVVYTALICRIIKTNKVYVEGYPYSWRKFAVWKRLGYIMLGQAALTATCRSTIFMF